MLNFSYQMQIGRGMCFEYDAKSNTIFALVDGFEKELGYQSIDELEQVRGHLGLFVERDLSFTPTRYGDLKL